MRVPGNAGLRVRGNEASSQPCRFEGQKLIDRRLGLAWVTGTGHEHEGAGCYKTVPEIVKHAAPTFRSAEGEKQCRRGATLDVRLEGPDAVSSDSIARMQGRWASRCDRCRSAVL